MRKSGEDSLDAMAALTAQANNTVDRTTPGVIGPDDTVTTVALNVDEISRPW